MSVALPTTLLPSQIGVPVGTTAPLGITEEPPASANMVAPTALTVAPTGSFVVMT